jgi:hypothetical protein
MGMLVGCVKYEPLKNDNKNKLMTPSSSSSGMRNLDGRMTGQMMGRMDGKGGPHWTD